MTLEKIQEKLEELKRLIGKKRPINSFNDLLLDSYFIYIYEKIKNILPLENQIAELENLLNKNWTLVKGSMLSYTADSTTVPLLCDIAEFVCNHKNTTNNDIITGKVSPFMPIEFLMPGIDYKSILPAKYPHLTAEKVSWNEQEEKELTQIIEPMRLQLEKIEALEKELIEFVGKTQLELEFDENKKVKEMSDEEIGEVIINLQDKIDSLQDKLDMTLNIIQKENKLGKISDEEIEKALTKLQDNIDSLQDKFIAHDELIILQKRKQQIEDYKKLKEKILGLIGILTELNNKKDGGFIEKLQYKNEYYSLLKSNLYTEENGWLIPTYNLRELLHTSVCGNGLIVPVAIFCDVDSLKKLKESISPYDLTYNKIPPDLLERLMRHSDTIKRIVAAMKDLEIQNKHNFFLSKLELLLEDLKLSSVEGKGQEHLAYDFTLPIQRFHDYFTALNVLPTGYRLPDELKKIEEHIKKLFEVGSDTKFSGSTKTCLSLWVERMQILIKEHEETLVLACAQDTQVSQQKLMNTLKEAKQQLKDELFNNDYEGKEEQLITEKVMEQFKLSPDRVKLGNIYWIMDTITAEEIPVVFNSFPPQAILNNFSTIMEVQKFLLYEPIAKLNAILPIFLPDLLKRINEKGLIDLLSFSESFVRCYLNYLSTADKNNLLLLKIDEFCKAINNYKNKGELVLKYLNIPCVDKLIQEYLKNIKSAKDFEKLSINHKELVDFAIERLDLNNIINSATDLGVFIRFLNPEQQLKILEKMPDLAKLVGSFEDYMFIAPIIRKNEPAEVFFYNKTCSPKLIKSANDLESAQKILNRTQLKELYAKCRIQMPNFPISIIKNICDFCIIINFIRNTYDGKIIIIDIEGICKNKLNEVLGTNATNFIYLLRSFYERNDNDLNEVEKKIESQPTNNFLKNYHDIITKQMKSEKEFLVLMLNIIKDEWFISLNIDDIHRITSNLPYQEIRDLFFNKLKIESINSIEELINILLCLNIKCASEPDLGFGTKLSKNSPEAHHAKEQVKEIFATYRNGNNKISMEDAIPIIRRLVYHEHKFLDLVLEEIETCRDIDNIDRDIESLKRALYKSKTQQSLFKRKEEITIESYLNKIMVNLLGNDKAVNNCSS